MMTVSAEAEKNWGKLPDLFDQGVGTLPQLLIHQALRYGDHTFHRKKDFGIWQCFSFNWAHFFPSNGIN